MAGKTSFKLDNFRSTVLKFGLARTNRFEVIIATPPGVAADGGALVSLMCEQTNFPPLNIATKPFKIFGPTYQRPITSEYGGDGISMTFHVDRNMDVRKMFERWMNLIVDPVTFTVNYQQNYVSTIRIRQHDEQDNITHEVELLEAFPRNINLMDLNHNSTNQTHRLNILFAYRYWRAIDTATSTNPTPVPRMIQQPQVISQDARLTSGLTAQEANDARRDFALTDPRRLDI